MKADLANFEKQYQTRHAPEWDEDIQDREWLTEIPCTKARGGGHIYTMGKEGLGYMGNQICRLRGLLEIKGVSVAQQGDQEFTVRFPVELLDQVAKVVGAKKRFSLSEEHRSKLRDNVMKARNTIATQRKHGFEPVVVKT